uniref:Uncharacterized protein n=1 Tax=Amphimedon queenslandica TaxID=400682 RepID=A0A1X7U040_AMPQE
MAMIASEDFASFKTEPELHKDMLQVVGKTRMFPSNYSSLEQSKFHESLEDLWRSSLKDILQDGFSWINQQVNSCNASWAGRPDLASNALIHVLICMSPFACV